MANYEYLIGLPWNIPWYDKRRTIDSVLIEDGVTSIGRGAFNECTSLTSVTIPNSVKRINDGAFIYCHSLTSVTIPDGITSIGNDVFNDCDSLTSVTIPNSVTRIGRWTFSYCRSLTSVTIPNSVTSIGDYAFNCCSSLTSVTIPDSVTSIGDSAFMGCDSLTSVTIPNSVTSIGGSAFTACDKLTAIEVSADNSRFCSIDGVLFNKNRTELICCPAGKTVSHYTIPNSVTSIDDYAFYYCSSLTSVTIPDSVKSIGERAFCYCDSLTSVTIPDGVTSIGDFEFGWCRSLTSVKIPNSVTSIGIWAFYACHSLTSVTVPDGVTSIGESAFFGCNSLTSATIPDSVTSIGSSAFESCSSLTSLTIPYSVTSIGEEALLNCNRLTAIEVDADNPSYCSMDGVLFNKSKTELICCPAGKTVNRYSIPNSVTSIDDCAFYYCSRLTSVTIPDSVTSISDRTFTCCGSLTSVTIPDSVTSIGDDAFFGCGLKDVYYGGTEQEWNQISIGSYNDPLMNATIHFNSTGPSDPVDPTEPTFENIEGKPITSETEISFNYNISETSKRGTWHLPYADSFLSGSAKEFHQNLAIISLGLTMASSNQKEGDHHTGAAYLQAMLEKMGFDKSSVQVSKSYADTQKQTDTCEYAFAVKKLVNSDDYVVCAVVRSNGYGGEWISNAHVYNGVNANHSAGFKGAADGMYTALQKYLRQINVDKSHIRLWVTGFSRGGAIANLLGARLSEEIGISADKIFVYGFAVPRTVQKNVKVRYENIFNIINQCDLVPRVPLQSWGYERYGIDRFLPCVSRNSGWYSSVRTDMEKYFNKMMNLSVPTTIYSLMPAQERALDVLLAYLSDIIPSVYSYRDDGYQNAVMHACKGWQIEGEEISIDYILNEVFGLPAGYAKTLVGLFDDWSKQDKKEKALSVLAAIDLLKDWKDENGTEQAKRVASALIGYFTRLKAYEEADLINGAPYRELINLISDQIARAKEERAFGSALLMQHWPETYLSWMMAGDEDEVYFNSTYKIMYIKCPVDVTVYDGNNRVAARIVNDQIDESVDGLYCEVNEYGEKMIFLPDDTSYRTVITAREKGDMDIVVQEYSAEDTLIDADCYIQLPMEERQTFQVNTESDCTVATNGRTLDPSNTLSGNNQTVTIRATSQTGGSVIGAKDYSLGDTAELIAIPDQDYSFTGWYEGSRLLSTEEVLHFSAVTGRSLTAKFERTTPLPSNPFTDVKESAYYYEPVLWAVNHVPQITNGTGDKTFSPEWECQRCQIVTFLWRAMGCPEPTSTRNPFVDVKPADYFYKPVLWAVEKGITNGMDLTHFDPTSTCTRGQAVTFLWRAEGRPAPRTQRSEFTDVQNPNDYFYTPVLWAVENGITNGTGNGLFSPNMICLREQIVTFLYRDLK